MLSDDEATALLDRARGLRHCAQQGIAKSPLAGKNIGLIAREQGSAEARLFLTAASTLGARVAAIRFDRTLGAAEKLQTARLLGRLYDALECQGVPEAFIEETLAHAGIPVFSGLASPMHPIAALALRLEDRAWAADNRLYVLQAALVIALT